MILADKIIYLRKKSNWSQEELAQQLNVSRQSVSKWESGLSIPDLDKIIKLSQIFAVSTDYLIKDDIEELPKSNQYYEPETYVKDDYPESTNINLEQATTYMSFITNSAKYVAMAISLFILSPIPLLFLVQFSQDKNSNITEDFAAGLGTAILLIFIAIGVSVLIVFELKSSKWEFLEKNLLNLDYGIAGIVEKKKQQYEKQFTLSIAIGVCLCILGVVPLLIAAGFDPNDMTSIIFTNVLLLFVSMGVFFIVKASMINSCYNKLLQTGDYTAKNKILNHTIQTIAAIYWSSSTALYLYISFTQDNWDESWIVWPIAGVLYIVLVNIIKLILKRK